MMKRILFATTVLLTAWIAFGEGPKYNHKDPFVNMEFQNSYQDIRTKMPIYSSSTFATLGGTQTWTGINTFTGVADGSDAGSGKWGEYASSAVINATALANSTWKTLASIPVPPGDWDVSGQLVYSGTTASGWTDSLIWISTATNTTGLDYQMGHNEMQNHRTYGASDYDSIFVTNYRYSTATQNVTLYLKGYAVFTGGTVACRGRISARRVR